MGLAVPSELLTVAEVKEHVTTGLSDTALGRLIDAQDSYIQRMVGPHDPATTMVYETDSGGGHDRGYASGQGLQRTWLPRPASSISTVEDRYLYDSEFTVRDVSEYYLSDGGRSVSLNHQFFREWFRALVRVTFTPVSENAERAQALIDLVRLETQDTGLESEKDDTYTYKSKDKLKARREIIVPLKQCLSYNAGHLWNWHGMMGLDRFKGWRICTCQPHSHICPFDVCKLECVHPHLPLLVDFHSPSPSRIPPPVATGSRPWWWDK